jgi:acylphosphatase
MPRVQLTVRGHVQGVWFRGAMQQEARHLGLVGWARNCADGSVEAEASGPRAALDALVRWAHHGPPAAEVSTVSVTFMADTTTPESDFAIRR